VTEVGSSGLTKLLISRENELGLRGSPRGGPSEGRAGNQRNQRESSDKCLHDTSPCYGPSSVDLCISGEADRPTPCSRRSPKLDRGTQCLFQSSLISDAISAEPHVSPDRLKPISFTRSINMSSASETLRASPPCLARRRLVRSGFQPDAYDQRNKLTRVRSRSCNTRLCRRHVGNSSPRAAQMFNTSSKSNTYP
jgi:hypothetical protein